MKLITAILILEWGIIIGLVSTLEWWNLLIHPILFAIGWGVASRVIK